VDKERFITRRNLLPLTEDIENRYSNPDNDPHGSWQSVSLNAQAGPGRRQEQFYSVTTPSGRIVDPPSGRCWTVTKERLAELSADGRVWYGETGNNVPREKLYRNEATEGIVPHTLWTGQEVGTTDTAKKELLSLFDGVEAFDTPKPVQLLQRILQLATDDGGSCIALDFFAGSGTLADAVQRQNAADGGTRKFLLVQLPELLPDDSPARTIGLHTLSSVTIERVKRTILANKGELNLAPDTGFKVYKLTKSNFPRCEFMPDPKASEEENVEALRRYIHEKEAAFLFPLEEQAEQAVFDEVLLKCGFQLHYSRARRDDFAENTVFAVTDGKRSALVCLAWNEPIKDATLKRLRELDDKPFFICLERSLNTTVKWNLDHLLGKRLTAF
jgi:adenine-specific DNA-methyltransferase